MAVAEFISYLVGESNDKLDNTISFQGQIEVSESQDEAGAADFEFGDCEVKGSRYGSVTVTLK